MCRKKHLLIAFVVSVTWLAGPAGCSRRPADGNMAPRLNSERVGQATLKQYDFRGDGKIDRAELERCPALKAAVEQIDPQHTGEITAEMIAARIKAWQKSKIGRMPFPCRCLHNGKPLAGAEVKFVPEEFLGPMMPSAAGTTDQNGIVRVSIHTDPANRYDPPGVPPGFYRVEITKADEQIPVKYNQATTLGQEVAIDAKGVSAQLRKDWYVEFNLDY